MKMNGAASTSGPVVIYWTMPDHHCIDFVDGNAVGAPMLRGLG